jgi:hypothetical protein
MKRLMNASQLVVRFSALALLLLAGSGALKAQGSGYDVFQTGSGASVDLSSMNLGVVSLQGVPIQSSTGNADTIMFRPQAVPAGGGTIPVNLYALFMKSVSPVNLNGSSADVYVTVNASSGSIPTTALPQPDALSASTGTITVYPNSAGTGGTFDSTITINADIIFVKAGTSVFNSANYLESKPAPAITLSQTGSSYSTSAPSGYPLQSASISMQGMTTLAAASSSTGLSSGGFYPKPVHNGPHPVVPAKTCSSTSPTMSAKTGTQRLSTSAQIMQCVSSTTPTN